MVMLCSDACAARVRDCDRGRRRSNLFTVGSLGAALFVLLVLPACVTASAGAAGFADAACLSAAQIYLYGNSLRSYILAVVVPSQGAPLAAGNVRWRCGTVSACCCSIAPGRQGASAALLQAEPFLHSACLFCCACDAWHPLRETAASVGAQGRTCGARRGTQSLLCL